MPKNSAKHIVKRDTKPVTEQKVPAKIQANDPKIEHKAESSAEHKEPRVEKQVQKPKKEKKAEASDEKSEKVSENIKTVSVKSDTHTQNDNKNKKGIPEELERELKFKSALNELRNEIGTQTKVLKDLKSGVRKLETSYQHDMNKAVRAKRRKNGPNKPTGFVKELELPKELADLINVPEGTKISMPSYTKKFYEMLKRENLFYENDGRVLRANDQIKKVFNLPDSVNESTNYKDKNGFNFYTLQKHIAAVNKDLKAKADAEVEVKAPAKL